MSPLSRWSRLLRHRLWSVVSGVSIRTKILGIALTLVLLLSAGIIIQVRLQLESTLRTNLREQSLSISRDVAARARDPVLIGDLFSLDELLQDTKKNNPDVRFVFVLDAEGDVVAHTFEGGFPMDLIGAHPGAGGNRHRTVAIATSEGSVWQTATSILGDRAGEVHVGLSETRLEQTLTRVTRRLLMTAASVAAIGAIAGAFLTWLITRPILSLVDAAQAVSRGDLSPRVKRWARDEIGELTEAFNSMTAGLRRAEQERAQRDRVRAQLLNKVITAQEDERKRIARELHDETGQALTSLMVGLRTLQKRCDRADVQAQLEELRQVTARTLDSVHDLAIELRPRILDDLGLIPALEHQVSECRRRHGLVVDLVTHGLDGERLPPPVETTLYRAVQESLTNVARHAKAGAVSVLLEHRKDLVRAIVEDDGCGFEPRTALASNGCLGLYGIQERATLLGGTMTVESRPGAGTSVYVRIPLTTEPEQQLEERGNGDAGAS